MLEFWKTAQEGIKRLRDVGMPAWMYSARPEDTAEDSVSQEGPEDTPVTKVISNALTTGTAVQR